MSIAPMDFQFISLTIEKLQAWADKNNVDLSAEIASTKAKVKDFYSHSEGKPLSRKQKRSYKLNSTDVIVKSSKASSKIATLKQSNEKPQKKPKTNPLWIDFSIRSKLVKGISYCHFCKIKRLECREQKLFNGTQVLVCKDCRSIRHKQHLSRSNIYSYSKTEDALDHSVSGSYEAGKRAR